MLAGVFDCAPSNCPGEGLALKSCAATCGEDVGAACLLYTCGEEWNAFYACMEPHLESGGCNTQIEGCGVALP